MSFDLDLQAIAEGVCNSCAGSTIESLIDLIDATVITLHATAVGPDAQRWAADWLEVRTAIVAYEGHVNPGELTFADPPVLA